MGPRTPPTPPERWGGEPPFDLSARGAAAPLEPPLTAVATTISPLIFYYVTFARHPYFFIEFLKIVTSHILRILIDFHILEALSSVAILAQAILAQASVFVS